MAAFKGEDTRDACYKNDIRPQICLSCDSAFGLSPHRTRSHSEYIPVRYASIWDRSPSLHTDRSWSEIDATDAVATSLFLVQCNGFNLHKSAFRTLLAQNMRLV